jgi:hypothetical protein
VFGLRGDRSFHIIGDFGLWSLGRCVSPHFWGSLGLFRHNVPSTLGSIPRNDKPS